MSEPLIVPAVACNTCPYRRDTPSGLWDPKEYAKLAIYDRENPPELAVFWCHQSNGPSARPTVCRGWLSTHRYHVAVRLACAMKRLRPGDVPRGDESATYYATGTEARSAGLADIDEPSPEARAKILSLIRRGVAKPDWEDEDGE